MTPALPRSAGGGVVLRRLAAADLAAFQAYRHDPDVTRYQDWWEKSDAEGLAFLSGMNTAELLQPGIWSQIGIAEAEGGSLIGDIGLFLAPGGREAEIGFALRRQSQGRGMATAAVREAINLVFEHTHVDRVVGIVDARNLPSIRLLQRVGMQMTGSREVLFRGEPCVEHVYVMPRHRSVTFRPAEPNDAAACIDLRGRTRQNAVSAARLAALGITEESWSEQVRTRKLPGHVCRSDGKMIGYCFGDAETGEVVVLALLPDFEDQGIGKELLRLTMSELRSRGHQRLFLGCSDDPATRSHGFYRHLGWRSTGTSDSNGDEVLEYIFTSN